MPRLPSPPSPPSGPPLTEEKLSYARALTRRRKGLDINVDDLRNDKNAVVVKAFCQSVTVSESSPLNGFNFVPYVVHKTLVSTQEDSVGTLVIRYVVVGHLPANCTIERQTGYFADVVAVKRERIKISKNGKIKKGTFILFRKAH